MLAGGSAGGHGNDPNDPRDPNNQRNPHDKPTDNPPKRTKGRQKIEMKMIEDENARLSTFSKRRAGIMKKGLEMSILCGVIYGALGFTAAGHAFSFGNPNIEVIIDAFSNGNIRQLQTGPFDSIVEGHRRQRVDSLARRYNWLVRNTRTQQERGASVEQEAQAFQEAHHADRTDRGWWNMPEADIPDEELPRAFEEIDQLERRTNELRERFRLRRNLNLNLNPNPQPQPQPQGDEAEPSSMAPAVVNPGGSGTAGEGSSSDAEYPEDPLTIRFNWLVQNLETQQERGASLEQMAQAFREAHCTNLMDRGWWNSPVENISDNGELFGAYVQIEQLEHVLDMIRERLRMWQDQDQDQGQENEAEPSSLAPAANSGDSGTASEGSSSDADHPEDPFHDYVGDDDDPSQGPV